MEYWQKDIETMSREDLEKYQLERLKETIKAAGNSPFYSKVFKENTGKSPMEYYQHLKIIESKKLIREEKYSISEISDMLGYSSIHIFSRAFKKAVGFSPTAYKKSIL